MWTVMLVVAAFMIMQVAVYYFSYKAYKNLVDPGFGNWLSVAWRGAFAPRAAFTAKGWRYRTLALVLNFASVAVLATLVII